MPKPSPEDIERLQATFTPSDECKRLRMEYFRILAADLGPEYAMAGILSQPSVTFWAGHPQSPTRVAFLALLARMDLEITEGQAKYDSAEAYRKAMLDDPI